MKKKLSSILGVSLALVLAFTLMGGFMPANTPEAEAEAIVPNTWNNMAVPSPGGRVLVAGSTVVDYAVANDGTTIYLLSGLGVANQRIAKSTNGGRTFSWINDPVGFTPPGTIIRVAPDDPETVALIDNADVLFISETGGAVWVNLGDPTLADASEVISDLAISPARVGTILDRDYVVCTYETDNATATQNWGDIYMVGGTTTWAAQATVAGANYDWTSIALAHNWVGERAVIGIGSDNVAGGNTEVGFAGDTYLVPINVNPVVGPIVFGPGAVRLDTATHDSPSELTGAPLAVASEIVSSDVVLPSDFDSTGVAQFRAYLGWQSTPTAGVILNADDAYRVDFNSPRKLEIRSAVAIHSLDYSGTTAIGSLYAGESDKTAGAAPIGVWFTSNPTSGLPSWEFSYKSPTSTGTADVDCKVVLAPDFEASNVVYGGCAGGPDTAFSKSEDGGYSFNGISMIDEAITEMWDVMPTPAGEHLFLASTDNATNDHSLWRCPEVPAVAAWDRVHFQTSAQYTTTGSLIRISPDNDAVYWFDAGGTRIQRSTSNGQIWGTRTAGAAVTDATVESADIVYHTTGANVYASTTGAWSFGLPVNAGIGGITDIEMAPSYPKKPVAGHVLIGAGLGAVGRSTDAGATFAPLLTFVATGNMQVLADKGYADNNKVFAASDVTGEGIYRYEIGVSTSWENIRAVAGVQFSGLAMDCGVLYGAWHTAGAVPSGADRNLGPTAPSNVVQLIWDTMDTGATAALFDNIAPRPSQLSLGYDDANVWLYAIDVDMPSSADHLFGYHDTMAKAATTIDVPAMVPYDPNTRGNSAFIIKWDMLSNTQRYEVAIYRDANRLDAVLTFLPTGVTAPPPFYFPGDPSAPSLVVPAGTAGLAPGADYYVHIRARDQVPGDAIRSQWAETVMFSIEAGVPIEVPYPSPELLGPPPGATGVAIRPGFAWGAFHGAEKYEFELATDPGVTANGYFVDALVGLTGDNALPTTAWQCDIDLAYGTNYYWHVKAITATGETPWSTGVFTTMSEEEIPAPPLPPVELPPPITPAWIWAIVAIGAVLVIVVIVLIFVTRKP